MEQDAPNPLWASAVFQLTGYLPVFAIEGHAGKVLGCSNQWEELCQQPMNHSCKPETNNLCSS